MEQYIMLIVIVVVFGGMMWWQSKKAKQQQQEKQDFRRNLQPGTEVITIGQVIGKVVEVDEQYEEIVIDSEGSKLRFGFNAIAREYIRPAYVSDDEVDENGNPPVSYTHLRAHETSQGLGDVYKRQTMRLVRFRSRRPSCPRKTPLTRPVTTTKPRRSKLFDSVAPSAYRIAKA